MAKAKEEKPDVKYPKGETVYVTYYDRDEKPLFLLTAKPMTGYFFLYEFTVDGLVKRGKGLSPLELEGKFEVRKRMDVE